SRDGPLPLTWSVVAFEVVRPRHSRTERVFVLGVPETLPVVEGETRIHHGSELLVNAGGSVPHFERDTGVSHSGNDDLIAPFADLVTEIHDGESLVDEPCLVLHQSESVRVAFVGVASGDSSFASRVRCFRDQFLRERHFMLRGDGRTRRWGFVLRYHETTFPGIGWNRILSL